MKFFISYGLILMVVVIGLIFLQTLMDMRFGQSSMTHGWSFTLGIMMATGLFMIKDGVWVGK